MRGPVQVAYAVDDVVAAAESWVARGAGPFFIREHIDVSNSRTRGQALAFDHSSAYGQWGELMVELICEHHGPGDRIGPQAGVHHVAFFVDDVAAAQEQLLDRGWAEALYAEAGSTSFAMHDATGDLGHLVEIYHDSPRLLDFYAMVKSAAATWDGSNPTRFL